MENLYLIRHGETDLNVAKVYYGATDCPLNEKGKKQAEALQKSFDKIPVDLVYTSPLIRAADTAKIIFGDTIKTHTDPRLKEMNFGIWEGRYYKDIQEEPAYIAWMEDWEHTPAPNGESYDDLAERVEEFYQELIATEEKNVAIVCHNAVLMLLLPALLSLTRTQGWHFAFGQGVFTHINFTSDFPVLKGLNIKELP